MPVCAVCRREARGHGWFDARFKAADPRRDRSRRRVCSRTCQDICHRRRGMIDPTPNEQAAMAAGGDAAGAYLESLGRSDLATLTQPVQGWVGGTDPFLMGPTYTPADGVRRFQSGTPPVLALGPVRDMLELVEEASIEAVREKSVGLTGYAVRLADELLAQLGVEVASPRDPALRGGHVTLRHPAMKAVTERLWQRDVIPDYRDPGGLRIGLSPLSTSYAEVERGLVAVREVLSEVA